MLLNHKKKSQNEPFYYITVCYTCEQVGAAVPNKFGDEWVMTTPTSICRSSSVMKSSAKFINVGKMVGGRLKLREMDCALARDLETISYMTMRRVQNSVSQCARG